MLLVLVIALGNGVDRAHAQYNDDYGDEVVDSGCRSYEGTTYDPYTDRVVVYTNRDIGLRSAYDADRGFVDPGSYRYESHWQRDAYGNWMYVSGPTWTSFGRRHGELDYTRRTALAPGVDSQRNTRVAYSLQNPTPAPRVAEQRRTRVAFSRPQFR